MRLNTLRALAGLAGALAAIVATSAAGLAQTSQPASGPTSERKPLTFDLLYGSGTRPNFNGSLPSVSWSADGNHYTERRGGSSKKIEALSGATATDDDVERFKAALLALSDFDESAAQRAARNPDGWDQKRQIALIERENRFYLYDAVAGKARRLADPPGGTRERSLSPGGRFVVYVRDNNLYALEVANGRERRLTRDGTATLLNGVLDWVYQEEIYGRGTFRAYWTRADDQYIAFLQLDESRVPLYTLVDQSSPRPPLEQTNYPKPGDPNPGVRVGVVRPGGGGVTWADLSAYTGVEILVMRVSWAPDGALLLSVADREQRWLELVEVDPRSGAAKRLIREQSGGWSDDIGHPRWLSDQSFLWLSDRDGWRHVYHYARDGRLIRRVTSGDWNVRRLEAVREAEGHVYVSGECYPATERHLFRAPLGGGAATQITESGFNHRVDVDPSGRWFFDNFSNLSTPNRLTLRETSGKLIRVIDENEVAALQEYALSRPELVSVPARDGLTLNGLIIRPPNFDPTRKYALWYDVYSGPDAPSVNNNWAGGRLFHQLLASEGIVVFQCDPRSACGRGPITSWQCYRRLGQTEMRDSEDAIRWMIGQGYIDESRIGMTGYSYGGYMTAYALTHSKLFKLGIAGAPVTDWRFYDTIYTERYMLTPDNNPDGYQKGSVVGAGAELSGQLVLIHGLLDDNVHFHNSAQLMTELQKHRKNFELMVYPRDRHGIQHGSEHYRDLLWRLIRERL